MSSNQNHQIIANNYAKYNWKNITCRVFKVMVYRSVP